MHCVVSRTTQEATSMSDAARRLPLARSHAELLVEELADELLIFDRVRQEGHCLNRTAALVWRHCDGVTTVGELAAVLEGAGMNDGRAAVAAALAQLEGAHLVAAPVEKHHAAPARRRVSRRGALRR